MTNTWTKYQTILRYGKAKVTIDFYVDKDGAITDMIFDVREIFEKFKDKKDNVVKNKKTGETVFINDYDIVERLSLYSRDRYFKCRNYKHGYENGEDDDEFMALGISLIGYNNVNFNKYTPWASVLFEFYEALDRALGFEGKEKKNTINRLMVDKIAPKLPFAFWLITFAVNLFCLGGLLLIILGIAKVIPTWAGWVFGLLVFLPSLFLSISLDYQLIITPKEYRNNSGDMEKHYKAPTESAFTFN